MRWSEKKPGAPLHGRVDSFVVETDVRHPTDVSLLWDAVRTALGATVQLAETHDLADWRQHRHWWMKLQHAFQAVRRKRGWTQKTLVRPYLRLCTELLARMQASRDSLPATADTAVLDERLAQRPSSWIKSPGGCSTVRRFQPRKNCIRHLNRTHAGSPRAKRKHRSN